MTLTPVDQHILVSLLDRHLPSDVVDAILTDTRWDDQCRAITGHYQHDHAMLEQDLKSLSTKLAATPRNRDWAAHQAHSPASWLTRNLT